MTDLYQTRRNTVDTLEKIIGKPLKVLDKGFVRLIDYMGDDNSIVQAARVSYGKGTKTVNNDRALIRYLLRHKHTTPFEMCEIKLHIKAPIFIARQWLRHRTANVNEYSARYSTMEEDYYIPEVQQIKVQSESNKQGRGKPVSSEIAEDITNKMVQISKESFIVYNSLLNLNNDDENPESLAKELARAVLPVNVYTQFYWKIDLHNLLHFLRLRADEHAQYEIRVYAQTILDIIKQWVPHTYEAFTDYAVNSFAISQQEMVVINKILSGDKSINQANSGLSKREWATLLEKFDIC